MLRAQMNGQFTTYPTHSALSIKMQSSHTCCCALLVGMPPVIKQLSLPSQGRIRFLSAPRISSDSRSWTFHQALVVCALTFLTTTCGVHDRTQFWPKYHCAAGRLPSLPRHSSALPMIIATDLDYSTASPKSPWSVQMMRSLTCFSMQFNFNVPLRTQRFNRNSIFGTATATHLSSQALCAL